MFRLVFFLVLSISAQAQNRDCRVMPPYTRNTGFDLSRLAFSTSERKVMGLNLVEISQQANQPNRTYQHPSWKKAGWLGPIVITEKGEVWVAPVPIVNVLHNKIEEQKRLWKVNAQTAEMTMVLDLPSLSPPNQENPFGILGMAYDCDNGMLYVTSVAGSTRKAELGSIFAINSKDLSIVGRIDSVDAMGVGVGTVAGEKRLYFGKTRSGEIMSVALSDTGNFSGSPQTVFSLEGLGPRGDDHARKIRFSPDGKMLIQGVEFYYNLTAPTEKQETNYRFTFVPVKGWVLESVGG
jgi:hypothetical protein